MTKHLATPAMPGLSQRALDLLKVPKNRTPIPINRGPVARVPVIPNAQRSKP